MSVKCSVVANVLEEIAPRKLAEDWDHVGLLVGSPDQEIQNILVTLDVTAQAVEFAVKNRINLIISHHPLLFKAIHTIRTDLPQGKLLADLLSNQIAVYAAHTNLDSARGGVNDVLAERLGLGNSQTLRSGQSEGLLKLVVYVPQTHLDAVRSAITEAGAGHIGNYSHCAFATEGTGSFLPLAGTHPFLGKTDQLEYVSECRLETILPEHNISQVLTAMRAAHPYEEVAYDLYPLFNKIDGLGLGRIGDLPVKTTLREFALLVCEKLGTGVKVCGDLSGQVQRVAVCGGSGADLIQDAVRAGADLFVTGDIKYHEAQQAAAMGLVIIDAGHFATEYPVVAAVVVKLRQNVALQGLSITGFGGEKDIFDWIDR